MNKLKINTTEKSKIQELLNTPLTDEIIEELGYEINSGFKRSGHVNQSGIGAYY